MNKVKAKKDIYHLYYNSDTEKGSRAILILEKGMGLQLISI